MYDLYEAESEPPSDTDEVAFQAWEQQRRYKPITMPETFTPPKPIPETARVFLKGRWLQVIFKLANIHLTPDRPEYPGGAWHIEGTSNESIVATGIYYYDCHNIEEVSLDFRTAVTEPNYEQGDERGLERVYGFGDGQPLNQNLGSIKTRHGQCIVFPNIFQHHVSAFRLVDPTLPGHRKILCMFLVDPSKTTAVPPQNINWFTDALSQTGCIPGLPNEIIRNIARYMDGLMTVAQARVVRDELMEERCTMQRSATEELFEEPFSLCEH
eukprot:jgi/Hompol1/4098/HPOL_006920-RA